MCPTITLSDEINSGGGHAAPTVRAAPAARATTRRSTRTTRSARPGTGPFRAGSLPQKLVAWAGGRKKPFGVADVMKALKVKRSHASVVLTAARKKRAVKRVGRGEYAAA